MADDLFENPGTRRRVGEMAADVHARLNPPNASAAATAQSMQSYSVETGQRMIRDQYRRAGIEPHDGYLVSLSMLFSMGWTVEDVGHGIRKLVAPPAKRSKAK